MALSFLTQLGILAGLAAINYLVSRHRDSLADAQRSFFNTETPGNISDVFRGYHYGQRYVGCKVLPWSYTEGRENTTTAIIGEQEINSISQIIVDGKRIPVEKSTGGKLKLTRTAEIVDIDDKLQIWFRNAGEDGTVFSELSGLDGWNASNEFPKNTSYLVIKRIENEEGKLWNSGYPSVKVRIEGLKIDGTYTENPILCVAHHLREVFGLEAVYSAEDVAYCDEQIDIDGGQTEARYRIATSFNSNETLERVFADFEKATSGWAYETGDGKVALKVGRYSNPVTTLTNDDVLEVVATTFDGDNWNTATGEVELNGVNKKITEKETFEGKEEVANFGFLPFPSESQARRYLSRENRKSSRAQGLAVVLPITYATPIERYDNISMDTTDFPLYGNEYRVILEPLIDPDAGTKTFIVGKEDTDIWSDQVKSDIGRITVDAPDLTVEVPTIDSVTTRSDLVDAGIRELITRVEWGDPTTNIETAHLQAVAKPPEDVNGANQISDIVHIDESVTPETLGLHYAWDGQAVDAFADLRFPKVGDILYLRMRFKSLENRYSAWSPVYRVRISQAEARISDITNLRVEPLVGALHVRWTPPTDKDYSHAILRSSNSQLFGASVKLSEERSSYLHKTDTETFFWVAPVSKSGSTGSFTGPRGGIPLENIQSRISLSRVVEKCYLKSVARPEEPTGDLIAPWSKELPSGKLGPGESWWWCQRWYFMGEDTANVPWTLQGIYIPSGGTDVETEVTPGKQRIYTNVPTEDVKLPPGPGHPWCLSWEQDINPPRGILVDPGGVSWYGAENLPVNQRTAFCERTAEEVTIQPFVEGQPAGKAETTRRYGPWQNLTFLDEFTITGMPTKLVLRERQTHTFRIDFNKPYRIANRHLLPDPHVTYTGQSAGVFTVTTKEVPRANQLAWMVSYKAPDILNSLGPVDTTDTVNVTFAYEGYPPQTFTINVEIINDANITEVQLTGLPDSVHFSPTEFVKDYDVQVFPQDHRSSITFVEKIENFTARQYGSSNSARVVRFERRTTSNIQPTTITASYNPAVGYRRSLRYNKEISVSGDAAPANLKDAIMLDIADAISFNWDSTSFETDFTTTGPHPNTRVAFQVIGEPRRLSVGSGRVSESQSGEGTLRITRAGSRPPSNQSAVIRATVTNSVLYRGQSYTKDIPVTIIVDSANADITRAGTTINLGTGRSRTVGYTVQPSNCTESFRIISDSGPDPTIIELANIPSSNRRFTLQRLNDFPAKGRVLLTVTNPNNGTTDTHTWRYTVGSRQDVRTNVQSTSVVSNVPGSVEILGTQNTITFRFNVDTPRLKRITAVPKYHSANARNRRWRINRSVHRPGTDINERAITLSRVGTADNAEFHNDRILMTVVDSEDTVEELEIYVRVDEKGQDPVSPVFNPTTSGPSSGPSYGSGLSITIDRYSRSSFARTNVTPPETRVGNPTYVSGSKTVPRPYISIAPHSSANGLLEVSASRASNNNDAFTTTYNFPLTNDGITVQMPVTVTAEAALTSRSRSLVSSITVGAFSAAENTVFSVGAKRIDVALTEPAEAWQVSLYIFRDDATGRPITGVQPRFLSSLRWSSGAQSPYQSGSLVLSRSTKANARNLTFFALQNIPGRFKYQIRVETAEERDSNLLSIAKTKTFWIPN